MLLSILVIIGKRQFVTVVVIGVHCHCSSAAAVSWNGVMLSLLVITGMHSCCHDAGSVLSSLVPPASRSHCCLVAAVVDDDDNKNKSNDDDDDDERWRSAGLKTYIYSSGSREAQRQLFGHTQVGDMRPYLSGFFDTNSGPKISPASYKDIALSIGADSPSQLLFATGELPAQCAAICSRLTQVSCIPVGNGVRARGEARLLWWRAPDVLYFEHQHRGTLAAALCAGCEQWLREHVDAGAQSTAHPGLIIRVNVLHLELSNTIDV
eukprot:1157249-Pelagomonas_calceolata.AAC.10